MDVEPPQSPEPPQPPQPTQPTQTPSNNAQDKLLLKLSTLLEQLEANPDSVPLIKQQIQLMNELQMVPESLDATLRLASLVMLSEDQWLSHMDLLISTSPQPLGLEHFVNILERFEQAEQDYLSVALLLRHVEFIIGCTRSSAGVAMTEERPVLVDSEVRAFLTPDAVRGMLRSVIQRGNGLLSESHLLWQPWIDWEIGLARASGQTEHVHALFGERMAMPHSTMETTATEYSSFCSELCPEEYESRLVQITSMAQPAKVKWSIEKRFGRTREDLEHLLAVDPSTFSTYVEWETDPHATNPKNERSPTTDPYLTRTVFERAIASYARAAYAAEKALQGLRKPSKKGKGKAKEDASTEEARQAGEQTLAAYKAAEAGLWERYATWAASDAAAIRHRAVRACPQIGSAWRHHLNQLESNGASNESLAEVFDEALNMGLLDQPSDLSDIFVCRGASLNRLGISSEGNVHPVLQIASQGFDRITRVSRSGDPTLRLEKFLLDWAETHGIEHLDEALNLLDKPLKSRAATYQMVLLRSGVEARQGRLQEARDHYSNALQRTDLDWPEAVHEAFIQFETVHGDLTSLASANALVETERIKLAKRRERAAEIQQAQVVEQYSQPVADVPAGPEGSNAPESTPQPPAPAPVPTDDGHFKRDREHTTVLVNGLASTTDKTEVEAYFAEIGHVRETTLLQKDDGTAALVEFRFADAVPIALERDGKKLGNSTIRVSMLWRSTLFVTNFPRDMDDAGLRQLFNQYGTILQTRWPSRKYADARRFCYVTMDSPAHAQECLVLNGLKINEFPLTVLISDPAVKAKRTDADESVNRTLFIGGLTPNTTEQDIEAILRDHGQILHVKLGWDPLKRICKGFAFVEMATEDSAKSALVLNGTQRLGKFLKVQMSDPNHAGKKPDTTSTAGTRAAAEKRLRTIRLHNLPDGTQEGLLQQALEKIAPVKRVEIFAKSHEAIAELASQSDVGVLLLRPEPFIFNGATIVFTEQDRRQAPRKDEKAKRDDKATTSALAFAPRAARRGGKTIGKPRRAVPVAPVASQSQESFREFVQTRNSQLAEGTKRKGDDQSSPDAKRQKAEEV